MSKAETPIAGPSENAPASALPAGLAPGLVAGALAAVPALLRGPGAAGVGVLLCSMACAAPLCLGLRRWNGTRLRWLALGIGAALLPVSLLGEWLVKTTHHRPLGAVTFAVFAVAVIVGASLVAARLLAFAERVAGQALVSACFALTVIGFAVVLWRGEPSLWLEAASWFALVALAALAPARMLERLPNARVQTWVWVGVLLGALAWAFASPDALRAASPVLSFPLRALVGRA